MLRAPPTSRPQTPLLHTKGTCGTNDAPFINIPENATNIEIIINNLSPTAHNIHLHGMLFQGEGTRWAHALAVFVNRRCA